MVLASVGLTHMIAKAMHDGNLQRALIYRPIYALAEQIRRGFQDLTFVPARSKFSSG